MYRLFTLLLFLPLLLPAQTNQGTIIYKETLKLEYPEEMANSPFADRLPKERVRYLALYFQGDSSLYMDITKEWEDTHGIDNDNYWMRRMTPQSTVYYDMGEEKVLRQQEFLEKMFLVDENMPDQEWKIVMQPRSVIGYTTFQALYEDTSKSVEARFVPELPFYFGPENYFKLPGLVLAVNIDEGRLVIQAIDINFDPPTVKIVPPTEGKNVSKEEFDKIVEEKVEEMKGAYGGRASRFIRMFDH